ncbi:MAG: serine/threonine protein kinase [Gammaproteobacteria bacterium]
MEPDELKAIWRQLSQRLERQETLQNALLGERKREHLRSSLRPLVRGQWLQVALGVALMLLGIACWRHNPDAPRYLVAGATLHAFGVVTAVFAGITLALASRIDYGAPVLQIENRLARLRRFYALNGMLAGWPWWVMWVIVVVAVAGLAPMPIPAGAPGWIWGSLAIGALGWIGTAWFHRWSRNPRRPRLAQRVEDAVTGFSLRRARALLEEVREFERE